MTSVELEIASGTVRIPISSALDRATRIAEAEAIAYQIEEARSGQKSDDIASPEFLSRTDGTSMQWVRRLRARAEATSSFREADEGDRLWRVVSDEARKPSERAAAAVALGPRLAQPDRLRIEQVAQTTAAPALRIALEAVAQDEEEAALAEALEEVERTAT